MNNLSIFTTCKPMVGLDAIHQENAIRSWLRLKPRPRIILVGNDDGVMELCERYQLTWAPSVEKTEYGKPDVAGVFQAGWNWRGDINPIMAYVNADILLYQDFVDTLEAITEKHFRFIVCGQRLNLDVPLRAHDHQLEALRAQAVDRGEYLKPTGTDYFAFYPGRMFNYIPSGLGIGHLAWDNFIPWSMVAYYNAIFIDATRTIVAVHQNHPEPNFDGHPGAAQNHRIVKSIVPPELHATCGLQLPQALKW
jgi:hypothetical protein